MDFYKMIYMSKKFLTLEACTKFILNCDKRLSQFTTGIVNRQMLETFRLIIGRYIAIGTYML